MQGYTNCFCRPPTYVVVLCLAVFVQAALTVCHGQQQVLVETPFQQLGNSFYENNGIGWNFSRPNFYINVPNGVQPPFGLGNPGADAQLGFGVGIGGGQLNFNLAMGQGSTTTNSVTSPSIMLPNGGTGSLFHGSFRPFVTSFVPVVGGFGGTGGVGGGANGFGYGNVPYSSPYVNAYPQAAPVQAVSPIQQKLQQLAAEGKLGSLGQGQVQGDAGSTAPTRVAPSARQVRQPSSAERGDVSVAEIRRNQAAEDAAVGAPYEQAAQKAAQFESQGKLFSARQYYKQAARQAPKEHQSRLYDEFERVGRRIEADKNR